MDVYTILLTCTSALAYSPYLPLRMRVLGVGFIWVLPDFELTAAEFTVNP